MRHRVLRLNYPVGVVGALSRWEGRWCAVDRRDDFATHIDRGVVVVFLIGSRDSKADEYNWGIDVTFGFRVLACGSREPRGQHVVLGIGKLLLFAVHGHREGACGFISDRLFERNWLIPFPGDRRMQAHAFEFGGHVACGDIVARSTGSAALQQRVR